MLRFIQWFCLPVTLSCGIAVVIFVTNRMVPFSNDGHCDPWHYFGYFYVDNQISMLGDSRTYSRLPSVIVGFVTTRIFHSISADYANFLILFAGACTALYCGALQLFRQTSAVLATIFFATNAVVIGNFSVTYTGPSLTWSAIAIAFAIAASTAASTRRRNILIVAAGFFWGTSVIGHLYSLTYNCIVPLYALRYVSREWRYYALETLRCSVLVVAGGLLATLAFGLLSQFALHDGFLFFLHQFKEVFHVLVAEFQRPNWFLHGGKGALLLIGTAMVGIQAAWCASQRRLSPEVSRTLTAVVPLGVLLILQFGYAVHGGITLEYDYYYVWMMVPFALVLASLLDVVTLGRGAAITITVVYAAAALAGTLVRYQVVGSSNSAYPSLAVAAFILVVLVVLRWKPYRLPMIALLALSAALAPAIRPERMGVQVWQYQADGAPTYTRLREGMEFLSSFPFPTHPKFWISDYRALGETVAYPRGYDYCLIDTALPNFLPATSDAYNSFAEQFNAGDYLVMAAPDEKAVAAAKVSLQQKGLAFEELRRKVIDKQSVSYLLLIGRLQQSVAQ